MNCNELQVSDFKQSFDFAVNPITNCEIVKVNLIQDFLSTRRDIDIYIIKQIKHNNVCS